MRITLIGPVVSLLLIACGKTGIGTSEGQSVIGTWKHESYREALRSTLVSRIDIRRDSTFHLREIITPVPGVTGGIRYVIPDSTTTVTINHHGQWEDETREIGVIVLTFTERHLLFDDTLVDEIPDAPMAFFWNLISIDEVYSYPFPYTISDNQDLVLFLLDDYSDQPPTYFAFFDEGSGSLFSRQ